MKALIFNNQIVDIQETEFEVSNEMTWIDCPEDTTTNHRYDNGQILEPILYVPTTQDKIRTLESQVTQRNLRSAMLGDQYAIDQITSIENQIAALRQSELS